MSDAKDTATLSAETQCPEQSPSPSVSSHTPASNYTPHCDNDDTPTSQNYTPSPNRVDDPAEESFQNPEPPKELADLLNADNIGGTVFSKHWLFTTLMRLLEVIFPVFITVRCSSCLCMCTYTLPCEPLCAGPRLIEIAHQLEEEEEEPCDQFPT